MNDSLMHYGKKRGSCYLVCIMMLISCNLYFVFLMRDSHIKYLVYLDLLLILAVLTFAGIDYVRFRRLEEDKRCLMERGDIVCLLLPDFENRDIAVHDVSVLNERLEERFRENCELQDYVAKWCHEMKIPLAAALLLDEKIGDAETREAMREQLEKMNQQLNSLLLGCRLQSALFDIQIKKTSLTECVRTAVRNNQFFLIQKKFTLDIKTEECYVYTDPAWLVYILDQLLNNAVKYARENPVLRVWTKERNGIAELFVEDNGEGIRESDIRRIFEKGFTGSNYHNGRYKSTGMGLYMVSRIAARLEHGISVESEYGKYTRFRITFQKNSFYQC